MHIARSFVILATAGLLLSATIAQASNRMVMYEEGSVTSAATSLDLITTTLSTFIELVGANNYAQGNQGPYSDPTLSSMTDALRTRMLISEGAADDLQQNMKTFDCKLQNSSGFPRSLETNPAKIKYECRMPAAMIKQSLNVGKVFEKLNRLLQGKEKDIRVELAVRNSWSPELLFTMTRIQKNSLPLAMTVLIKPIEG